MTRSTRWSAVERTWGAPPTELAAAFGRVMKLAGALIAATIAGAAAGPLAMPGSAEAWAQTDQAIRTAGVPSRTVTEEASGAMEIPSVIAMEASPLHLYVLSESDGLVVFRSSGDSLNWLYSSTGMQRRGQRLQADPRFAYLTGQENRITIIEPTSVLGVYSSTTLPATPRSAARTGLVLWIAMGSSGLGAVSLESPEAVDSGVRQPFAEKLRGHRVLDVASDPSSTLFILSETTADQRRWVHTAKLSDPDSATYQGSFEIGLKMTRLHLVGGQLFGSTDRGDLLKVLEGGREAFVAGFGSALHAIHPTHAGDGSHIVRTRNGKIWIGSEAEGFELIRSESEAGNHIGVSHHGIRIAQYGRISRLVVSPAYGEGGEWGAGGSGAGGDSSAVGAAGAGGGSDAVGVAGAPAAPSGERTPENRREEGGRRAIAGLGTPSGLPASPARLKLLRIADKDIPAQRPLIVPIGFEDDPLPGAVDLTLLSNTPGATLRGRTFFWQPPSSQAGSHSFTILATSATGQRDTVTFNVKVHPFNQPPRFAPVRLLRLPAGAPFQTFFSAIDPDGSSRDLVRYVGIDLPAGSRLNELTGAFEWTPAREQAGRHGFRIVATDGWGSASSVDVDVQVVDQE